MSGGLWFVIEGDRVHHFEIAETTVYEQHEVEMGERVADAIDSETYGWGPLDALIVAPHLVDEWRP